MKKDVDDGKFRDKVYIVTSTSRCQCLNKSKLYMNSQNYRQGDVLLIPVAAVPSGFKKMERKAVTLALGEVTGHHHTIHDGAVGYVAEGVADSAQLLAEYVVVEHDAADLTHQEHDTIALPAGTYQSIRQTEFTPQGVRNVAD